MRTLCGLISWEESSRASFPGVIGFSWDHSTQEKFRSRRVRRQDRRTRAGQPRAHRRFAECLSGVARQSRYRRLRCDTERN